MSRYLAPLVFLVLVLVIEPAHTTTCSQANSECEAKGLTGVITGPPAGVSEAKGLVNVITNSGNISSSKMIVNIIVIPGTAVPSIIPAMPLTHFK